MLKKVIINTISNYGLKGVQLLLNLLAIPILIERFGEEGFGIILFAGVVVGYFNVLELGFSAGVTKYVAQYMVLKDFDKLQKIINTSLNFFIRIGLVVAVFIISWSLSGGIHWLDVDKTQLENYKIVFILAGFIALTSWPQMLLKSVFSGLQDFVFLNITLAVGRVCSVILAILAALYTDLSIIYIFLLFNLDKVLLTFWHFKALKKRLPFWSFSIFSFDKKTFKFMFSFSGWIMLGQIAILLEYQADQLIIISFLSVSDIATYSVIFYLFRLIQQISGLAASTVMPVMSQIKETSDKQKIKFFILDAVRIHNLIFVPITILLFFIAEPFIRLWMGEKYLEYINFIRLTIVFQLIWQSSAMFGQLYMGLGFSKKPGIAAIIIGVLNVLLSVILVNYMGVEGVVLGTIIVGVISVPFAVAWYLPDVDIKPKNYFFNTLFKTQAPLIIAGAVLFILYDLILKINSWLQLGFVSISILIYLVMVIFFIVLNKEQREKVKNKLGIVAK